MALELEFIELGSPDIVPGCPHCGAAVFGPEETEDDWSWKPECEHVFLLATEALEYLSEPALQQLKNAGVEIATEDGFIELAMDDRDWLALVREFVTLPGGTIYQVSQPAPSFFTASVCIWNGS